MPTRTAGRRGAGQRREQLAGGGPVVGPRLDSTSVMACDTAARRRVPDALDERRDVDQRAPSGPVGSGSLASRSSADSAITVPGQEHRRRAHLRAASATSSGGITPPMTTMMSGRPWSASACFSAGSRVRWPAASERDPDDVHVGVDGLLGDLLRRGEQRPHVDVEAQVGEGGDHDLLAAVVAVLAHLGDQDAGAAALGLLELRGGLEHRVPPGVVGPRCRTRRGTRRRSYGSRPGAGRRPSPARRRSRRPSPWRGRRRRPARAGCRPGRRPVGPGRGRRGQGVERPAYLVVVALGAQPLELGDLLAVDVVVVDPEHVERAPRRRAGRC